MMKNWSADRRDTPRDYRIVLTGYREDLVKIRKHAGNE
jgi:hypothetical protein